MAVALVYPCALTPWLLAIFLQHLKLEAQRKSTRVAIYYEGNTYNSRLWSLSPYFEVFWEKALLDTREAFSVTVVFRLTCVDPFGLSKLWYL
ncbi:hypothetical protein EDB19DRAFT_1692086, partial [Suillus lakei]